MDSKFYGLPEYDIILLKICFYNDDIFKILIPAFAFQGYIYMYIERERQKWKN
jgi:hypothetical protein